MAQFLDAALEAAKRGHYVFPLSPRSKLPAIDDFPHMSTRDPEQIRRWWTCQVLELLQPLNIGISTTQYGDDEALIVVDVDNKEGHCGDQTLLQLASEGFELPETLEQITPTGGRHLFFRSREPVKQGVGVLGPGLDIRSRHGYVVGAGSEVEAGVYTLKEPRKPALAPQWLIDRCGRAVERSPQAAVTLSPLAAQRAIKRAIPYLQSEAPASGPGEHNETAYRVVCRLKDMGVAEAECAGLLTEHWIPRCEGAAWSDDDLEQVVANAYHYGQEPIGAAAPEAQFDPVEPADAPVRFQELLSRATRPVEELVPGLIEKRIATFLDGPGGAHKSRVAAQIGLSIDAGIPVFSRAVEKCAFLYVSSEDDADEVARRAHAITKRLDIPSSGTATYWDRKGRDSALAEVKEGGEVKLLPFYTALRAQIQQTPGHKFVVLDSLYDFVRFVGKAKIDEGSINAFIKRTLGDLCTDADCSLLVIRHPSQAGADRGDFSGWSVANHNAPRARLSMSADSKAKDTYTLKVEKRNHGPIGEPIKLHWADGALLPRNALATAEQNDRLVDGVTEVAAATAAAGLPFTEQRKPTRTQVAEIEKVAGFAPSHDEIRNALHLAVTTGRLKYCKGTNKQAAGYYPAENAEALAKEIRRGRVKTGVKTGGKRGGEN